MNSIIKQTNAAGMFFQPQKDTVFKFKSTNINLLPLLVLNV